MPNVFIEPMPKGETPITPTGYQLEFPDKNEVYGPFDTQEEAIQTARSMGHKPLVARVRKTDKGKPDHWREA